MKLLKIRKRRNLKKSILKPLFVIKKKNEVYLEPCQTSEMELFLRKQLTSEVR